MRKHWSPRSLAPGGGRKRGKKNREKRNKEKNNQYAGSAGTESESKSGISRNKGTSEDPVRERGWEGVLFIIRGLWLAPGNSDEKEKRRRRRRIEGK